MVPYTEISLQVVPREHSIHSSQILWGSNNTQHSIKNQVGKNPLRQEARAKKKKNYRSVNPTFTILVLSGDIRLRSIKTICRYKWPSIQKKFDSSAVVMAGANMYGGLRAGTVT